jgi:hypothetical protein
MLTSGLVMSLVRQTNKQQGFENGNGKEEAAHTEDLRA